MIPNNFYVFMVIIDNDSVPTELLYKVLNSWVEIVGWMDGLLGEWF